MDQRRSSLKPSKKNSFFLGIIVGGIFGIGSFFFLSSSINFKKSFLPSEVPLRIFIHKSEGETGTDRVKNADSFILKKPLFSSLKNPVLEPEEVKPAVALIFVGVGRDPHILMKALRVLPKQISFSFLPYTSSILEWLREARRKGHDVLLDLPLESNEYPQLNKGSYTLRQDAKEDENLSKLAFILKKGQGVIIGVYGFMGSRILASKKDMYPILKALKKKEYTFLEVEGSYSCVRSLACMLGLPYVQGIQILEREGSEESFKKEFQNLETRAREEGFSLGIISLNEVTLREVRRWIETLDDQAVSLVSLSEISLYRNSEKIP